MKQVSYCSKVAKEKTSESVLRDLAEEGYVCGRSVANMTEGTIVALKFWMIYFGAELLMS